MAYFIEAPVAGISLPSMRLLGALARPGSKASCPAGSPSARVGLTVRRRAREGIQRKTMRFDSSERWIGVDGKSVPARIGELRNEADIGERRLLSVTECAGPAVPGKLRLERREPELDPVSVPGVFRVLAHAERAGQILQHPQVVQRMDVARDGLGDSSHPGQSFGCGGRMRRLRALLGPVFGGSH